MAYSGPRARSGFGLGTRTKAVSKHCFLNKASLQQWQFEVKLKSAAADVASKASLQCQDPMTFENVLS